MIEARLTFAFTFLKDWGSQQKKANRSSEKNKRRFGVESDKRVTNDISPESSPGVGRRRTKTSLTFPHSRYMTQMSVPEQAELEKLKQRINFSDLDQVCKYFTNQVMTVESTCIDKSFVLMKLNCLLLFLGFCVYGKNVNQW